MPATTLSRNAFALAGAAIVAVLMAGPLHAVEVPDLYEAEVPVIDKSEETRETGLGEALIRVITKVTGVRGGRSDPAVAGALKRPGGFVQQFRYRMAGEPGGTQPWRLWARFDPRAVDGLIRDAGLRVWGRVRPAVMVWVAVERSGTRRLLGGEALPDLAGVVRDTARQRGIPVVLPLLDLKDQSTIRVSDVWGGFRDRIQAASARYQANVIFTGRVYRLLPTLWEGQFTMTLGDTVARWSNQGDILELLLADAVNVMADQLASRFAGPGGVTAASGFSVIVSGVHSVSDYARTLEYLNTLEQSLDVDVTRVQADEVTFYVESRGGQESLLSVIGLGGPLSQESLPGDPVLRFRLLP